MPTKLQTHLISNNLQTCSHCEHESVIDAGKPICGLTGEEILFFKDGYTCPAGKFTVALPDEYVKAVPAAPRQMAPTPKETATQTPLGASPCQGCGGAKYDPRSFNRPGGTDELIQQLG